MRKPKKAGEPSRSGEVVTGINFIRAETLLRKYPMHVLEKGSDVREIVIREVNDKGEEIVKWCVKFRADEGAPGPG